MKKHTIIGTAGHIDHGKTALIKALTQIDTDRLKEEKERGITIDIGFAYWKDDVTIIDVPGHEKFIRNMVAGVSTIDFFILVIAADDGIMPQTIEHLDILNFFNIHDGIVVINKIDLVDEEWLMLVKDEVETLLKKYNLAHLQIIEVSSIEGTNIDQLKTVVEDKIENHDKSVIDRPFRLLVDRSFSVKGFGTVVTGTVLSGTLNVSDDIQILPSGETTKVRGLQEHIKSVTQVEAGDRAAVNLQNIARDTIIRGNVLIKPNTLFPINEFLGVVKTVSKLPIKVKNYSQVRIHVGTTECMGKLFWFDENKILEPDKQFHVKIKLETPVAAAKNDAFLIRLHSPILTLAGGKIVEINPSKIKQTDTEWFDHFEVMSGNDTIKIIEQIMLKERLRPVSILFLQNKLFEEPDSILNSVTTLTNQKRIRQITLKGTDHYLHKDNFNSLITEIRDVVSNYHNKNPHKPGINIQEIIGNISTHKINTEVVEAALKKMINSTELKLEQNFYALPDFKIKVSRDTDTAISEVMTILLNDRFEPQTPDQIAEIIAMPNNEIRSLISLLARDKRLIQITPQFYIHEKNWNDLLNFLRSHFEKENEMNVSDLKDFLKASRKFVIPLFEFLDSSDYTHRAGNTRQRGNVL